MIFPCLFAVPKRTIHPPTWPGDLGKRQMTLKLLVNIDVPDLDRGVGFYRDGLGFAVRRWLFDRTVAELTCASVSCFLIEKRPGTRPVPGHDATRHYAPHWTPLHLDLVVPDVDLALTRAIVAGA